MRFGLIGERLCHSYSPEIHREIFRLLGIDGEYKLIELNMDELQGFLTNAMKEGYKGLNVTIPYKTKIIPFIDKISAEAEKIGAVNTISLKNVLKGYNTDYFGIKSTFINSGVNVTGKNALITGSGGASKSVVTYLSDSGINNIYIASRNPKRIAVKSEFVTPISYEEIAQYRPFNIVINATPVGMYPGIEISPLKLEHINGADFLFDLIYNPSRTELMKLAEKLSIPNVNGLYMLVAQAVKAHEIWNEKEFGIDFINSVYKEVLNL